MPYPTKRLTLNELHLNICEDVYEPAEDSLLFAKNLPKTTNLTVLDIGTGCGILAILAAKKGGAITAIDLNPLAIRCTKENAHLNNVADKITPIQGDLFSALKPNTKFDLILFNAPYLPSEPGEETTWIGRSWAGGTDGRRVIERFITQVSTHLKPESSVFLMQSTLTDTKKTLDQFNQQHLTASIIAEQNLPFFETLTLITAKPLPV